MSWVHAIGAPGERALRPLAHLTGALAGGGFWPMRYADAESIGGTAPLAFELFKSLPDAVIDVVLHTAGHDGAGG